MKKGLRILLNVVLCIRKKMKLIKKLFELQTELTSYTYPVVKLVICLTIIGFGIGGKQYVHFSSVWFNILATLFRFVIAILCILFVYISIGELFYIYSNRRGTNRKVIEPKPIAIHTIVEMVSENDIIEIEVSVNQRIIKLGSSSDCKYSDSKFTDKLYYIGKSEYKTIELFTDAITALFPTGSIPVLRIDGLVPER